MFSALLFSITLYQVGSVPLPYGMEIHKVSIEHSVDPFDLGAILLSEHAAYREGIKREPRYNPFIIGRHGRGGEFGLFQIFPNPWASHCGIKWWPDLLRPGNNIECAAKVVKELKRWHGKRCKPDHHWLSHYRCTPTAVGAPRCNYNVRTVLKNKDRLKEGYDATATVTFWMGIMESYSHMQDISLRVHQDVARLNRKLREIRERRRM